MFDPSIGRWITEDPELFDAGDVDLYRAFGNNPVDNTDPTGLAPTKVTIKSLFKPIVGTGGIWWWAVAFSLDDAADACLGGWVLQHVKSTVKVTGKNAKTTELDYWEAWRVEPGKDAPALRSSNAVGRANLDLIASGFYPDDRKKVYNVMAHDWFWNANKMRNKGQSDFNPGQADYIAQVYYIDKVGADEGPGKWKKDYQPAGGLNAIETAGNEAVISGLFAKYPPIGPWDHILQLQWKKGGAATLYNYYPR